MRRIALAGLKLGYYLRREGISGALKRVGRTLDHREMTYERYKEQYHIDQRSLRAMDEWLEQHPLSLKTVTFGKEVLTGANLPECEYILLESVKAVYAKDARYSLANALEAQHFDVIYADHDIHGETPVFKPDYNPVLWLTSAYIGPVLVVRRALLKDILTECPEVGENYWRLAGAILSRAETVHHIPQVLYRIREAETIEMAAWLQMVDTYLASKGICGHGTPSEVPGCCKIVFDTPRTEKISVIVPNKNHLEDLRRCIQSIERQRYPQYEVIIVENGSDDSAVHAYYQELKESRDNIKVVHWTDTFNYAAVNNFGVKHASGSQLLFLNNDVELMGEDVLWEMAGWSSIPTVGAVGIKLLYPDETIQHAGVIVGYGGIAGHAFLGCSPEGHGYMNRIDCAQNYSAVTAACMMIKRSCFEAVGGFDEAYQIAWNDIDLCLRIREAGYANVYTPEAVGRHDESKSRGAEDTCKKMQRYNSEVSMFRKRWMKMIREGDPAYNRNLSLYAWDFRIG